MAKCVFCDIAQGKISAEIVLETEDFIAFNDINPQAPVHVIVAPKKHITKKEVLAIKDKTFLNELLSVVYKVIKKLELNKTGYQLVNNGAGYNHFDHEHVHVLGGKDWRPFW